MSRLSVSPDQGVARLMATTMLLLLLYGCGGRDLAGCTERMNRWSLPADLCRVQGQLTVLTLPATVDSIDWLSADLKELSIRNAPVSSLEGLPSSLRVLDATGSALTDLDGLPDGVRELHVAWTPMGSLHGIPASVRTLSASDFALGSLQDLPEDLLRLSLELRERELLDLSGLPRRIEVLSLSAALVGGVRSSSGVPASVRELSLTVPETQLVDLPGELEELRIDGPALFEPVELPEHLVTLRLEEHRFRERLQAVFPFLLSLQAVDTPVGGASGIPRFLEELVLINSDLEDLGDLPSTITHLGISSDGLPGVDRLGVVVPELERLALNGWNDLELGALNEGLEALDLTASRVDDLSGIPRSVHHLDLSWTGLDPQTFTGWSGLTTLVWEGCSCTSPPPLPPSVTAVDLSDSHALSDLGGLPEKLTHLDASYTAVAALPNDLPATLEVLDISGTKIAGLANLPEGLVSLTLTRPDDGAGVTSLEGLPSTVRELHFVDP